MFDDDSGWIAYDIAKYNPYYEVGVDTSDMNYEILIALKESKVLANMLADTIRELRLARTKSKQFKR
jgi:hypothetical protein